MKPKIGYAPIPPADEEKFRVPAKTKFRWDGQPQRCPKRGEWYMSGAIVEAYCAPNDLSTKFFICVAGGLT